MLAEERFEFSLFRAISTGSTSNSGNVDDILAFSEAFAMLVQCIHLMLA